MTDFLIALAFIFMVVSPCIVAMHTGVHSGSDDARLDDPDELAELAAHRDRIPD